MASTEISLTVKLWNVDDGKLLQTLKGHSNWIISVSFSPDSRILASSSGDSTIKLWDVRSGSLLQTLKGHSEPVWSVSFSPDGKSLASAGRDHTVKLWNLALDLDDLMRMGCPWLKDYLATHPQEQAIRELCQN